MREFFHSWRRKVGVTTLLVAICFTIACGLLAMLPDGLHHKTVRTDSVVRCDLQGIHFEKTSSLDDYGQIRGVYAVPRWSVPHFSIIGILILLSAYLILWPGKAP